ncbi:MAG: Malonyl CoA-acyl carrier protein transacylase [Alphaproteobacteria bacterium ADurb.Bin438]|nr:MAG: Malonyl CoA-acyl carrier protein transacylase [Alphaproteobacteria bacterium ADurb.Bin438]
MTLAFVFPGQGSQAIGMGKDLYDNFKSAKDIFDEVSDALDINFAKMIFEGEAEVLNKTENTQPALMTVSQAVVNVLKKEFGYDINQKAKFLAGHSLGEYSALCASNALSVKDGAKLLRFRGLAMSRAVPEGIGAMAAVLGLKYNDLAEVVKEAGEVCVIANDNCEGQVVISGSVNAIDKAIELAGLKGAKRSVKLAVSVPSHSPLMAKAADEMAEFLKSVELKSPACAIIPNVKAEAVKDVNEIKELLVKQLIGQVRWRESVKYMCDNGVETVYELGSGKVLTGINKRISSELKLGSIGTIADIENFIKNN